MTSFIYACANDFAPMPIIDIGDEGRPQMQSVIPDLVSDRRERRVSGIHAATEPRDKAGAEDRRSCETTLSCDRREISAAA